jgi:lysophospholipase L1-like esterase
MAASGGTLTVGGRRSPPTERSGSVPTRALIAAAVLTVAAVLFAAVGGTPSASKATPGQPLHLVVLGDSTARASECAGCTDYAHLYAKDVERATGRRVQVQNLGEPKRGLLQMLQATQALGNVYGDHSVRRALADADIVLVGLGFNDTAWARLDDPCDAAPDFPVVRWDEISDECQQRVTHELKQTLDVLLTQVDQFRAGRPSILRIVTPYDAVIGDTGDPGWDTPEARGVARRGNTLMTAAQCEIAGFHGGACADAYHALNGADGTASAQGFLVDGTHLNQAGHRRVAQLLADLGYGPLAP